MKDEIKLTKLAKCAGCGAKVGAGILAQLLGDIRVRQDENLLVGYIAQMLQNKQACHMAIGLRGRPLSAQKARQRCFQRETSRPCLPT